MPLPLSSVEFFVVSLPIRLAPSARVLLVPRPPARLALSARVRFAPPARVLLVAFAPVRLSPFAPVRFALSSPEQVALSSSEQIALCADQIGPDLRAKGMLFPSLILGAAALNPLRR